MAREGHEGQRLDRAEAVRDQEVAVRGRAARLGGPLLLAVVAALLLAGCGGGAGGRAGGDPPVPRTFDLRGCRTTTSDALRDCYAREFVGLVQGRSDPKPAVDAIARRARGEGGFLLANCHGIMHTVGRTYARGAGVTLSNLMRYLPQSNDPGCSAGFAHGMVTAVAGDIDPEKPAEAATVCAEAGTRYQRYSCVHGFGHAFMRLYNGSLRDALQLCSALGEQAAPDCAQGSFHDYWFAVAGADDAPLGQRSVKDPRELCASQLSQFVRPCWYRAFIDNRPEGFALTSPADLSGLCDGLTGDQRAGCMTAGSVIGPADPAAQLDLCAGLRHATDAAACIRGVKVQNIMDRPSAEQVRLIAGCARLRKPARAPCYRWLGKTLAVVTDGAFERDGCPRLTSPTARRQCAEGAATMDDALVTFS